MTNYVFIGTGTTDETGKAKLDHDANGDPITHSYTGTGAGEVDIVASLDDPQHINSSSLQETYTVWDTLFYCNGTDTDHNPNWFESTPSTMTVSRSPTGTTVSKTGSGNLLPSTTSTASSSWSTLLKLDVPLVVEFEIVSGSGLSFRAYNNSNQTEFDKGMSVGLWKFVITSNSAKCYKDGVEQTLTASNFESKVYLAFASSGSTSASITFKNFKIYSS